MKRVLAALASIVSLALIVLFAIGVVSLVQSEVIPALAAGSFRIQTSSMILSRVWKGNELYWLLAAYTALVLILAVVFVLTARIAIRGKRPLRAAA
jgi:succinate dehydrogenase hydrophobic anchor subunit